MMEVALVAALAATAAALADRFYDAPVRLWLTARAKRKMPQLPTGEIG